MNVKSDFSDFSDRCRSVSSEMLAALRAGDDPAYETSAAEARALVEAQIADHLAAQSAPEIEVQDGPVRPGYAAGIAAYADAKTTDQRDRIDGKIGVTA